VSSHSVARRTPDEAARLCPHLSEEQGADRTAGAAGAVVARGGGRGRRRERGDRPQVGAPIQGRGPMWPQRSFLGTAADSPVKPGSVERNPSPQRSSQVTSASSSTFLIHCPRARRIPPLLAPTLDGATFGATNAWPDASRSSTAEDEMPANEHAPQIGDRGRKVEGLVMCKRGGSSSLPGRTRSGCKRRPLGAKLSWEGR
jgi:hypothetical protein